MSDEFVASLADRFGAPAALIERSAHARATAAGSTPEEVLAAWAGGVPAPASTPPPPAPVETPEPEPASEVLDRLRREMADDIVDGDEATPNNLWVDISGDVSPSEIWYYHVTAYNRRCPAEGPF